MLVNSIPGKLSTKFLEKTLQYWYYRFTMNYFGPLQSRSLGQSGIITFPSATGPLINSLTMVSAALPSAIVIGLTRQ